MRLVTGKAAATYLGLKTVDTLYRWNESGKLPAITLPNGRLRWDLDDIDAMLRRGKNLTDDQSRSEQMTS